MLCERRGRRGEISRATEENREKMRRLQPKQKGILAIKKERRGGHGNNESDR